MKKEKILECGMKYKVKKKSDNEYILYPVALMVGHQKGFDFVADGKKIPIMLNKHDLNNKYVVSSIYTINELKTIYEYDIDEEFLIEYYDIQYQDIILYVKTINDNISLSREINLSIIGSNSLEIDYFTDNSLPTIALNDEAIDELLNGENINDIKLRLKKYKEKLATFINSYKPDGITRIHLENGKIVEIETINDIDDDENECESLEEYAKTIEQNKIQTKNIIETTNKEISYKGLRDSIKSKIIGHDKEIDIFAQKLYMNYTALDEENIESILLVGPTGTGKTETVNAACSYLDIPSIIVNAANLVPNGIKGTCLEDVLLSLYISSKSNIKKAERGLVFLDEIDKLNDSDLDIKTVIKNILLTFNGGGTFPISSDRYDITFNSKMTNKIYAGVFDRINTKTNSKIGFNNLEEKNTINYKNVRRKIIDQKYFTLEELSRISTILLFEELTKDVKKQILLHSKLSELVQKQLRYKRQFNIEMTYDESFVDAIIDSIPKNENGMRSVNNLLKEILNNIERNILESEEQNYKKLVLTKNTVLDSNNFDLS